MKSSIDLKTRSLNLLRKAMDNPLAQFRPGQWEAVEMLARDRSRLLVVQRTGWGKSIVYFLTTKILREQGTGPTLLISPLLALMRNQIQAADRIGVRSATINSSNNEDWDRVKSELLNDNIDLLLVSPERLSNQEFRREILASIADRIGLFVVDEAHCISDWGHDFRPDYRRIVRIIQALPPNIPVLATTATANDRVVEDISAQLGDGLKVFRGSLGRESLCLQNVRLPNQAKRLAWLSEHLPEIPGSGIIYVLTVKDSQRVAEWLQSQGIDAHAYYGSLDTDIRKDLEKKLLRNGVKALVATSALGMGFDKPDLGFVIHFQRPGSAVHYYQQVGRAGRAMDRAYGILLCGEEDDEILEYFINNAFPPRAHVEQILKALEEAEEGLTMSMLEHYTNCSFPQINKALKLLEMESPSPVSKSKTKWFANPVHYIPDREKVRKLLEIRKSEQTRMQEYMESSGCLMQFLQQELNDPGAKECGRCAVCSGTPLISEEFSIDLARDAVRFLRKCNAVISPRINWPGDALLSMGWKGKIDESLRFEEGRAMCMWGDSGWGDLVRTGKQTDGYFRDSLVNGMVEMIKDRWKPEPFPEWITCVPSLCHPQLVSGFAERLAKKLKIPFIPCIEKVRQTEPQKLMQNSWHQAKNIAGAFRIDMRKVSDNPVFLIDDMVDSRWTFTIISAQLRESGSGKVFPAALAQSYGK